MRSRGVMRSCWIAVAAVLAGCSSTTPVTLERQAVNPQSMQLAMLPAGQVVSEIYFSPDGRRVAYAIKRDGKVSLVVDGKESQRYEDLHRVVFSPDGKGVAFRAMNAGADNVVISGKPEKSFTSIGELQYAPDGRLVYEAEENGKWRIVAGRREGPTFGMPYAAPNISRDGKFVTYIEQHHTTKKSNLRACTIDMARCAKGSDYDSVAWIRADAAKSHFVFIARVNGKSAIVRADISPDGQLQETLGPQYDEIFTAEISSGGEHVAYLARRGEKIMLVRNGEELPFPEHDLRSHQVVANNGRAFNIAVKGEQFFAVVDGQKTGKSYDEMTSPAFSQDGSQLAYAVRKGMAWFVVVNGVEGPPFDMVVNPQFSPDGTRLVYRARRQGERFLVVADIQGRTIEEHPPYELVWEPVFTADGKSVAYGAKKGQEVWWKVEPLK